MSIETITGNLCAGYKQLQPGTMLHVDELMKERRTNEDLRDHAFYTADTDIYFLGGVCRTPALVIAREAHNPILRHIDDAFQQLTTNGNYSVLPHDFEQAVAAPDRVFIALPTLRLQGDDVEWRYLEIRTSDGFINTGKKYATPNSEEQKVKERFGYTPENLAMLRNSKQKIRNTRLYFLTPEYVQKHAEKGPVARASRLYGFNSVSIFSAGGRSIGDRYCVRGVRRGTSVSEQEAPAGRGAQNLGSYRMPVPNGFKAHYDALLADREGAVKAMDDKTAAGLSKLLSSYLDIRGQ